MTVFLTAGMDVAPKDEDVVAWTGPLDEKISLEMLFEWVRTYKPKAIVCGDEVYDETTLLALSDFGVKVLSRAGNGWDAIDKEAAKKYGIKVIRQEGAYAEAVADTTMAMILAFARRLVSLNDSMHRGEWRREKYPGLSLREATIGIIGLGNIGKQVYDRAKAFGGKILIHRPTQINDGWDRDSWPLDFVLEESDFVTLHMKLCDDTRFFIGRKELWKMKETAYLINTSRGALVDENALLLALTQGKIAGAGLDVFEKEPLPDGHPFRSMDNVILSPHNAYWSPQERRATVHGAIHDAREEIFNMENVSA